MTREEYRAAMLDAAWLIACVVRGVTPDRQRVEGMDLALLYEASRKHMLEAAVAMALEMAGVSDERFVKTLAREQRTAMLQERDCAAVQERLEEAGIWYMPLKGAVIRELYPRFGMREMSDIDILFDADRTPEVRQIMEGLGFRTEEYEHYNHDIYKKPPLSCFEMHRSLFEEGARPEMYAYYKHVKERLVPDEGKRFGYHFTDEDFYLYLTAHEFKHYTDRGDGLRALLDTYVFLRAKPLDMAYVAREAEKLGICEFEEKNRALAFHLFDGESLTGEEKDRLNYMIDAGIEGLAENDVQNKISGKGRLGYLLSRLHPSRTRMMEEYPVLKKARLLMPVFRLWRLFRGLFSFNLAYRKAELQALLGQGKKPEE